MKKTKSKGRTALTAWASRTERCSVAQLPRRTKHSPRRQKVRSVDSSRTGSDGSGPAALLWACGASGMSSCSPFHFLSCASIPCHPANTRLRRELLLLYFMPSCLSLSEHLTSLSREKLKRCLSTLPLDSRVLFPLSCFLVQRYLPCTVTVSSLALSLKSIFFSWEEGQDKRSSIRFLCPTIAGSRAR